VYPAVILMCFISAADLLLAYLANSPSFAAI
jgi:hypothetical protein